MRGGRVKGFLQFVAVVRVLADVPRDVAQLKLEAKSV